MLKVNRPRGAWLVQSVEPGTLALRVVYSGPTMGIELTLKKKKNGEQTQGHPYMKWRTY